MSKKKNIKDIKKVDSKKVEEDIEEEELIEEVNNEVYETEIDDEDYVELSMEERIINIEKKTNTILILSIILVIISFLCLIFSTSNKGTDTTTNTQKESSDTSSNYSTDGFTEITASQISTLSKTDTIVVWIGRQGCSYCAAYQPYIEEAGNNFGIPIYYMDFAKFVDVNTWTVSDEEAWDIINNLEGATDEWDGFAKEGIKGTPLTLIIKKNKVVGGISGYTTTDEIEKAFTAAGISK